jgi:hypothetical protein
MAMNDLSLAQARDERSWANRRKFNGVGRPAKGVISLVDHGRLRTLLR